MTAPGQTGTNTTNAGTFVTFNVPGSIQTAATAINNPATAVTGGYISGTDDDPATILFHSFLRTSDGTLTPFDPPGTACTPVTSNFCSNGVGITPDRTIVGGYCDTVQCHGYLRALNGTFTVFDPPSSVFTFPRAINSGGAVTGGFFTAGFFGAHGFLRAPNGTYTTFDPLGSTYTQPNAINPEGTVTGFFIDVTGVQHGFLRTSDGKITEFDPMGSTFTQPNAINPAGTVTGLLEDASFVSHGFLRTSDGTITVFDPVGSTGTFAAGINPAGTIVGSFVNSSGVHGFLRAPNGTITVYDAPGSMPPVSGFTFTVLNAINPGGTVAGVFFTADFSEAPGFVVRPKNMH